MANRTRSKKRNTQRKSKKRNNRSYKKSKKHSILVCEALGNVQPLSGYNIPWGSEPCLFDKFWSDYEKFSDNPRSPWYGNESPQGTIICDGLKVLRLVSQKELVENS